MVICGQEFDFSPLNADDVERMEAAQENFAQANAAEQERPKAGLADSIRGQCRLVMGFLDDILGEGASDRLGLDGLDFGACKHVLDAFRACIAEEQAALQLQQAAPMHPNRAQLRAEKKTRQRTQTAGRIVSKFPVSYPQPPAAQMVERVDKTARRKALLAELAALDD